MTKILFLALGLLGCTLSASATTITFSSLGGPHGAAYNGHSEGGFTMTPTVGAWQQVPIVFGNPPPSIFSLSASAGIEVTSGGAFTFASVDLGDGDVAKVGPSYTIEGFLGASSIFSFGGADIPFNFSTINNPSPGDVIDRLVITMNAGASTGYNIDNIVVNNAAAVPDGGSTLMFLSGALGALGFYQRRLRRA
ncbi:MAG TPA: hypothetical protein VNT99_01170 [Methylomirabilota bacterium]|nr:hypothetical protein [Methylomirabilota bacterium]